MNFLPFLIPASLKEWGRILLVAFLVFSVTSPLSYCNGRRDERAAGVARLEKANRLYLEQKARADALAADQRITDLVALQRNEKALRDAIAGTPDGAPDAVRIQLGCERLRRANVALPAVCTAGAR